MITGEVPPGAQTRIYALMSDKRDPYISLVSQNLEGYERGFLEAIDNALSVDADKRPQTVYDFQANLLGRQENTPSYETEVLPSASQGSYSPAPLLSIKGRINRTRYWLYSFAVFVIYLGIVVLLIRGIAAKEQLRTLFVLGIAVSSLLLTWFSIATQVKRWHDLDNSGWWALTTFLPYINVVVFFILGFLDGTAGRNRYGFDPLKRNIMPLETVMNNEEMFVEKVVETTDIPHDTPYNEGTVTLLSSISGVPPIVLAPYDEIVIGRSSSADVQINNKYISGRHVVFTLNEYNVVEIRDLSSSNGTFIDGRKLEANVVYELRVGERLLIASEDVVYTL